MSTDRSMDKEAVIYVYNGRLLSHKKGSQVTLVVKNLPANAEI